VLAAFGCYVWRSQLVHGALPWQRNRKRELFELRQKAVQETEDRLKVGTEEATVVSPLATAGKGALTVRVPKAVADELRVLREEAEENARKLREAARQLQEFRGAQLPSPAAAAAFAPVPVGGAAAAADGNSPTPALAAPAPPAWVETKDPHSGRSYWFHSVTKETTWARPAGV
jgi:hypothetical protein